MADFSIMQEVVPELLLYTDQKLGEIWREWANAQPDQIRRWMTRPLSVNERQVLQNQFASDWFLARSLEAQDRVAADASKIEAADRRPLERLVEPWGE